MWLPSIFTGFLHDLKPKSFYESDLWNVENIFWSWCKVSCFPHKQRDVAISGQTIRLSSDRFFYKGYNNSLLNALFACVCWFIARPESLIQTDNFSLILMADQTRNLSFKFNFFCDINTVHIKVCIVQCKLSLIFHNNTQLIASLQMCLGLPLLEVTYTRQNWGPWGGGEQ